jgi:hypothetical protein
VVLSRHGRPRNGAPRWPSQGELNDRCGAPQTRNEGLQGCCDRAHEESQAKEERKNGVSTEGNAATAGLSMGSAMAMILSFQLNHSIWYMILHGVCSWFYVIYRVWQGNY